MLYQKIKEFAFISFLIIAPIVLFLVLVFMLLFMFKLGESAGVIVLFSVLSVALLYHTIKAAIDIIMWRR